MMKVSASSASYVERMSLIMWELKYIFELIALLVVNGYIMCVHLVIIQSLVSMYAINVNLNFFLLLFFSPLIFSLLFNCSHYQWSK